MKYVRVGPVTTARLAAVTLILAMGLGCVFAQTRTEPNGFVRGGDNRPLSSVTLRFRDDSGRVVARVTTGANGGFYHRNLDVLARGSVDGYIRTQQQHSSGEGPFTTYIFSPVGKQQAVFYDQAGRAMPGLPVWFRADGWTYEQMTYSPKMGTYISQGSRLRKHRTDRSGAVTLAGVPLSARFDVWAGDERFVVAGIRTDATPKTVRYTVTVAPTAVISGTLRGLPGQNLGGCYAFATDKRADGSIRYQQAIVNRAGRFRIVGLLPGRYYVGARRASGGRAITEAQAVRVQTGETKTVRLQTLRAKAAK